MSGTRRGVVGVAVAALLGGVVVLVGAPSAGAINVGTEGAFRSAWSNPATTAIDLTANVDLTCSGTTPVRSSATPITLDGHGFTLRNTCTTPSTDHGVIRSTGTGKVTVQDITIAGGRPFSNNGAGIHVTGSALDVFDSIIRNNVGGPGGSAGGGIAGDGGPVYIEGSEIHSNSSTGFGAAVTSASATTINSTLIHDNSNVGDLSFANVIAGPGPLRLEDQTEVHHNDGNANIIGIGGGGVQVFHSAVYLNEHHAIGTNGPSAIVNSGIGDNDGNGFGGSNHLDVISSTISGNEQGVGAPTISAVQSTFTRNTEVNVDTGTLTAFGSAFGDPGGGLNCDVGTLVDQGHNLSDDASCELPGPDVVSDLGLPPEVAQNGPGVNGFSLMPEEGSPLIDHIPADDCYDAPATTLTVDQRNFPRGDGEGNPCDVGAVEVCQDGTFSDVPLTHIFAIDICWMGANGITTGFPNGTYKPVNSVTREAMSAFMYRLADSPAFTPPVTPTFSDVPADSTFFLEIEWMAAEEITTGFPGGIYKPSDPVKRQSMSAFMYRLDGSPPFTPPGSPSFSDVGTGHPFFLEIEWMADEGITTGFNDGTYRPDENVSRQAMSAFMRRLAEGPDD